MDLWSQGRSICHLVVIECDDSLYRELYLLRGKSFLHILGTLLLSHGSNLSVRLLLVVEVACLEDVFELVVFNALEDGIGDTHLLE